MKKAFFILLVSSVTFGLSDGLRKKMVSAVQKQMTGDVKVEIEKVSLKEKVPDNARVVLYSPMPPLGRVYFRMSWTELGMLKQVPGYALIRAYGKVALAEEPIRPGQSFSEKNIRFEERELSAHAMTGFYVGWEKLRGKVAGVSIRPGSVISKHNAKAPYLVERNQQVELIYTRGAVKASTKGLALTSGYLKEFVQVKNLKTKKILQARVVGKGTVRIP